MLAKLETAFEHLGFISFAGYLFCAAMLILGSVISAMLKIKCRISLQMRHCF